MFEVKKGRKKYNQRHYEALGEVSTLHTPKHTLTPTHPPLKVITEEVYKLLEERAGLKRVYIGVSLHFTVCILSSQ